MPAIAIDRIVAANATTPPARLISSCVRIRCRRPWSPWDVRSRARPHGSRCPSPARRYARGDGRSWLASPCGSAALAPQDLPVRFHRGDCRPAGARGPVLRGEAVRDSVGLDGADAGHRPAGARQSLQLEARCGPRDRRRRRLLPAGVGRRERRPDECDAGASIQKDGQPCPVADSERADQPFIKRVVAGPGDELKIIDGIPIVNGEKVEGDWETIPCRQRRVTSRRRSRCPTTAIS